jgi:hypothetical protein
MQLYALYFLFRIVFHIYLCSVMLLFLWNVFCKSKETENVKWWVMVGWMCEIGVRALGTQRGNDTKCLTFWKETNKRGVLIHNRQGFLMVWCPRQYYIGIPMWVTTWETCNRRYHWCCETITPKTIMHNRISSFFIHVFVCDSVIVNIICFLNGIVLAKHLKFLYEKCVVLCNGVKEEENKIYEKWFTLWNDFDGCILHIGWIVFQIGKNR